MRKDKCDFCGSYGALGTMKIIGKPKHRMSSDELKQYKTRLGDNKKFEKRICEVCQRARGGKLEDKKKNRFHNRRDERR